MKQATLAWLESLAVNQIVQWDEDGDGTWAQAAIVGIKGTTPVTPDTMIEIQPEFGQTVIVTAGALRPVATAKVRIVIDFEMTMGTTGLEDLTEILRGNVDSAISNGFLAVDSSETVLSHEVSVSATDAAPLFTGEQRKEVIEALVEDMLDNLAISDTYPEEVARHGHAPGYEHASDSELLAECRRQGLELAEWFEWAEDGQFDTINVEAK